MKALIGAHTITGCDAASLVRGSEKKFSFLIFNTEKGMSELQRELGRSRGTQRIVSVNYLFGKPLIPSDFLDRIVTSNFRDMRNLISVVFVLLKMSFWVPRKG